MVMGIGLPFLHHFHKPAAPQPQPQSNQLLAKITTVALSALALLLLPSGLNILGALGVAALGFLYLKATHHPKFTPVVAPPLVTTPGIAPANNFIGTVFPAAAYVLNGNQAGPHHPVGYKIPPIPQYTPPPIMTPPFQAGHQGGPHHPVGPQIPQYTPPPTTTHSSQPGHQGRAHHSIGLHVPPIPQFTPPAARLPFHQAGHKGGPHHPIGPQVPPPTIPGAQPMFQAPVRPPNTSSHPFQYRPIVTQGPLVRGTHPSMYSGLPGHQSGAHHPVGPPKQQ
jgi:hypothetical protein